MITPIHVEPAVARRFLVTRHGLAPPRALPGTKDGVLDVIARLGSLQFDPLDISGRNHDLVLAARIAGYRRALTDELLYGDRALYETYNKGLSIVPTAELPWYRIAWDRARREHEGGAFDEHAPLVAELLERIAREGPLAVGDIRARGAIDWYWRPTNQVRAILEALAEAGILGIRRRDGNRRVYDLVERLFPAELLAADVPVRDRFRHKLLSRFRGHGLLGATGSMELWGSAMPWTSLGLEGGLPLRTAARRVLHAELLEAGQLVPIRIDGIRGERYAVADEMPILAAAEAALAGAGAEPASDGQGVAFLAPLDPLAWDRDFLRSLFGFDYVWEVYVPAAKRRWGYYVLPILYGDRLVGRIEPRFDRKAGAYRVLGLWWEDGFDPLAGDGDTGFVAAFADALRAHAAFGGLARFAFPRAARHRAFVRAVRARL